MVQEVVLRVEQVERVERVEQVEQVVPGAGGRPAGRFQATGITGTTPSRCTVPSIRPYIRSAA